MSEMIPRRVIFNYAARCNMTCKFCYVPFTGKKDTLENQKTYLDRLVSLGTELITFGGGDPFLDRNFRALLDYAATLPLRIQIDTNGLCLREDDMPLIKRTVDFMSLPLEGDATINALMRGNKKHFDVALKWLGRLLDEGVPVKINTVVTKQNIDRLQELAAILRPYAARTENPLLRWSLYEFIPSEDGDKNRTLFEITREDFDRAMAGLQKNFPDLPIEPGPNSKRKSSYFFISDAGEVYITDPAPGNENKLFIGHIRDRDICRKWSDLISGQDRGNGFNNRADLRLGLAGKTPHLKQSG